MGNESKIVISVIVPFYNTEKYIGDCISALLVQSYPAEKFEIIMIDNNSIDLSAEIVKRYPSIRLLSQKKQGAYAARNRGIRQARGEIIAFTDSDCAVAPDWLQKIADAMNHPRPGILIGRNHLGNVSRTMTMLAEHDHAIKSYVFGSKEKELYYGQAGNMAVHQAVFAEVGLFQERERGADTVFVRQAADRYSSEVIHYASELQVKLLEIKSLLAFYKKCFIYGKSRFHHNPIAYVRPLTLRERLSIFVAVLQNKRYSWLEAMFFFTVIVLAFFSWSIGSIGAAFEQRQCNSRVHP